MIISVLRGRIRPGAEKEYQQLGVERSRIASAMPSFVSAKSFFANDGEGVTIVQFTDADSQRAWRDHPSHQKVQERGRSHIFTEYSIHVASVMYSTSHRGDSAS